MKKQSIVFLSSISLMLIFALGGYFYKTKQSDKTPIVSGVNSSALIRKHSQTLGTDDAKVHIVEFLDPACETCASFYPYVKNLMAEYPGKVKLIIRYAPFHEGSDYVVKIIEAAKEQGKYWETLEALLQSQSYWASHHKAEPDLVWQVIQNSGLNMEKLANDLRNPEIEKRIEQDIADANALNVEKTPEFFVNGKPLPRFGFDQLKALVNSEINANY